MSRLKFAIVAILLCMPLLVGAQESVEQRKNQTITKADNLFGQRYTPVADKPLRLYDKDRETGPPDSVIYWHGSTYVIELVFATDGTVAKLVMLPEALLHSDTWSDVPSTVELYPAELSWLEAAANELQPIGNMRDSAEAPNYCFVSGHNYYCVDNYEFASANHYHLEHVDEKKITQSQLRDITISYKQFVVGVVENVRVTSDQRQLKIGGQWYHAEMPGVRLFDEAQIGSLVNLVAYGCTTNQKDCAGKPVGIRPHSNGQ